MSTSDSATPSALVIIDMQHIFEDPESEWFVSQYAAAAANVERLIAAHRGPVIWTKFVRDPHESGSWVDYYDRWSGCREPEDSPVWEITLPVAADHRTVTLPTFSKWGDELAALTAETPELILCGVATDCCVLGTALGAVDAGKYVTIVEDACAGITEEAHAQAVALMELLSPMTRTVRTAEAIG